MTESVAATRQSNSLKNNVSGNLKASSGTLKYSYTTQTPSTTQTTTYSTTQTTTYSTTQTTTYSTTQTTTYSYGVTNTTYSYNTTTTYSTVQQSADVKSDTLNNTDFTISTKLSVSGSPITQIQASGGFHWTDTASAGIVVDLKVDGDTVSTYENTLTYTDTSYQFRNVSKNVTLTGQHTITGSAAMPINGNPIYVSASAQYQSKTDTNQNQNRTDTNYHTGRTDTNYNYPTTDTNYNYPTTDTNYNHPTTDTNYNNPQTDTITNTYSNTTSMV